MHIRDYCFVSADMIKKIKSVEVGSYNMWSKYSDHVPLIALLSKIIYNIKQALPPESYA